MKRILVLLLALVLTLGVATGCGNQSSKEETDGSESNDNATESDSDSEDQVVLTIFHHMGEEPKRQALQGLADAYTKMHPEVTFDIQSIDYGQYSSILKTKISANESPDIIFRRPKSLPELVEAGHIMDLSDQDYINNMEEAALPCLTIDGKVYGVVLDVTAIGVFYNKDVFDKLGLEVPTTLDDYNKVIATLEENDILPFARGYKDSWTAQMEFQSDQFYVLKDDPNFFGAIASGEKKFSDYPQVAESLERWKERLNHGNKDIFGTPDQRAVEMVATGEAGMLNQGFWSLSSLQEISPDTEFGFFAPPISNDGEPQLHAFGDDGFMISETSKHKDIANDFFAFMMSEEGAKIWADVSGQISYVKNAELANESLAAKNLLSYIASGNTFGQEDAATFSGQMDATYKEYQELFPAVKDTQSVEDFIAELDAQFDAIR